MKIGILAWIDFAFRKIFGKPGNEICLISLLNAVLQLPHPVVSVEYLNPFGFKDFEVDKLFCVDIKANDQRGRVYWIKNAGEHTVEELHKLLPGLEFLRATGELNAIREKTGKYGLNLREIERILENLE